jgi:CO/xanthine dehydrogenase FAD-binding subunit
VQPSSPEQVGSTDTGPSPNQHLITLIADALSLPGPAADPAHERAYLRLVSRRAALAMSAARTALSTDSDAGAIRAARDLFGAVADEPATGYQAAPMPGNRMSS